MKRLLVLFSLLFFLTSCENDQNIVSDIEERDANEIIVFLANRDIPATKIPHSSSSPGGGGGGMRYNIIVPGTQATEAMAILNQNGLPRRQGTNLLDLFAKSGLMSSATEETVRYQAGLAQQIANTILKIDGVIDADVQLSFPPTETILTSPGSAPAKKITAAVYVKHQGVLDDPNSHLVLKIKRLVSGSVNGLDINDVTVISDRSRFTDISLRDRMEPLSSSIKDYVSIWSIVMYKGSMTRFRLIFFFTDCHNDFLCASFLLDALEVLSDSAQKRAERDVKPDSI